MSLSHTHHRGHGHDHSHGLVEASIKRSREGVRAVLVSLGVLGLAALVQTLIFVASGSVALLAAAGAVGYVANWIAAQVRLRAGEWWRPGSRSPTR